MKKLFVSVLGTLVLFSSIAQCDNSFFPFTEGVSFEQVSYDGKGKEQGKSVSQVKSVAGSEATIANTFYDKKGEKVANAEYSVICEESMIKLDFNNFIPEEMLSQYGDADVNVDGDFISLPNSLEVGQELPNSTGKIEVEMSGANLKIVMDMTITDRKVETLEPVETPAGSFQSYKITQKTIMQMNMMGATNTVETTSASWFAKKVGMVRTETYNKKGEVNGYTLLTSFSK